MNLKNDLNVLTFTEITSFMNVNRLGEGALENDS